MFLTRFSGNYVEKQDLLKKKHYCKGLGFPDFVRAQYNHSITMSIIGQHWHTKLLTQSDVLQHCVWIENMKEEMEKENIEDTVLYWITNHQGYQKFDGCHFEKTSIKVLFSAKCNPHTGNYGTEKLHLELLYKLQFPVWTFHSKKKGKK